MRFLPNRARHLALLFFCFTGLVCQAAEEHGEYTVKAVFLLNFTRFIEWPQPAPSGPLVIGVLGDDPFGRKLDVALQGEKVGARPVVAKRLESLAEIAECDALFISQSEKDRLSRILARCQQRPMLTVSDISNFAEQGGMVEMVTQDTKIRLRINVEAARDARLTISSKLLRPAQIVSTRKTSRHLHQSFRQRLVSLLR